MRRARAAGKAVQSPPMNDKFFTCAGRCPGAVGGMPGRSAGGGGRGTRWRNHRSRVQLPDRRQRPTARGGSPRCATRRAPSRQPYRLPGCKPFTSPRTVCNVRRRHHARIARVVLWRPRPENRRPWRRRRPVRGRTPQPPRAEVVGGVMADECGSMLSAFFASSTRQGTVMIRISIPQQTLMLCDAEEGRAGPVARYRRRATGERSIGSFCTPRSRHVVRAGSVPARRRTRCSMRRRPFRVNLLAGTRRPATPGAGLDSDPDSVALSGCEPGRNRLGSVDTMRRFIYPGSPDTAEMGVPGSRGCHPHAQCGHR